MVKAFDACASFAEKRDVSLRQAPSRSASSEGRAARLRGYVDLGSHLHEGETLRWVDLVDATAKTSPAGTGVRAAPVALEDASEHGQRPKLEQYPPRVHRGQVKEIAEAICSSARTGWSRCGSATPTAMCAPGNPPGPPSNERARLRDSGFLSTRFSMRSSTGIRRHGRGRGANRGTRGEIFSETFSSEHEVQEQLFNIRRELLMFRRAIAPLREVTARCYGARCRQSTTKLVVHLQDVYEPRPGATDLVARSARAHG